METDDRSLSPVVGVALLVGIVVALTVVFFVAVSGIQVPTRVPTAATTISFQATYDENADRTSQYLILKHRGGERIHPDDLKVVVTAGDKRVVDPAIEGSGTLSVGGNVTYNLTAADLCSSDADEVSVEIYHEPSQKPVAKQEVAVRRNASFDVVDNAVKSDTPYTATVTIPGSGYATLEGDYYLYWPFESRIVVTGDGGFRTLTPFPDGDPDDALTDTMADDINNPAYSFPMSYETDRLSPDEEVTVEMKSYVYGGDYSSIVGEGSTRSYDGTTYEEAHIPLSNYERTIDSSDPSEENIEIFRDGDQVPSYGDSSPHQDSLEDLLQHRIGDDGTLNLEENEFVAVFELNEDPDHGDFNDVAAVIELDPKPTYEETKEGQRLVCG
ncbi:MULTISPECIES: type IV pilin N-terminal domain-containing protein [Halorussus]|uniref:type IV pilin N-terminal domain-containing protein n=1 Tax=Halorussus TaxID=1070314 RepID=UPI0020A09FC5|nr:type IV pilin N-terminal domain-containing protein [Halorussus vallis]USZ75795.1 type IV pilin N-terminal domain-containing protein [Halorussus vallis]